MEHKPNCQSVEALYLEFSSILVGSVHRHSPDLASEAEDVVHNVFTKLQCRGTSILGDCSLASLLRHTRREAWSMARKRDADKRGGGTVTSLEQALEEKGFEPVSEETDSSQERILQAVNLLKIADRVIEETLPLLVERELILVRHIRKWVPVELSLEELALELTPMERQRFLPVRRETSSEDAEKFIVRQISRSKASLQQKLRDVRFSLKL